VLGPGLEKRATMWTRGRDHNAYFRTVARAVGVPDFWLDDAVQDMALAVWRQDRIDDPLAIRRRAIDAARRYGATGKNGRHRPKWVPLDAAAQITEWSSHPVETMDALRTWWAALTPRQRAAIRRRLGRRPMTNRDSASASAARRRLRDLLSA
jgi:hypothetical protein